MCRRPAIVCTQLGPDPNLWPAMPERAALLADLLLRLL
jgi:hypothetical protein